MRRNIPIFYSAILLTAVNLLLRFVGTSFQVYLSGRIGAAGIGLLQLVLSVSSLSITAGMAGVRTSTMYLTAEELGHKRFGNIHWILSYCGGYSLLCSCTISLCLYFFAPFFAAQWIGNPNTIPALRIFACFLPIHCLCGVMVGYFTAANRIATLAAVEIIEQFFAITITIILLHLWTKNDPARACIVVIAGNGAGAILTLMCLCILRIREGIAPGPKLPVGKRLLKIAIPLALADNLKTGISTAENLMVPKRLALYAAVADPLAEFGIVSGMVFPVMMFPSAILYGLAELLIPELARCSAVGSHRRIRYLVMRSLRVALLYGTLFAGLMFILAEPLCIRLYQDPRASIQLKKFALVIPMLYCDAITDAMTKGLGQQKVCVRYNIITSFLDVIFLYLLLPTQGMTGYFISFTCTHALNFGLSLARLSKITNYRPNFKTTVLVVLSCILAVIPAATVRSPWLGAFSFLILYCSLLTLLNVIGKEDVQWIRGLLYNK